MDRLVSITAIHRHWRLLNPNIWDDTVADITNAVTDGIPEGTVAVHQLSGPEWEIDNDTNVIRDPHLRQNRFRAGRRAAAAAAAAQEAQELFSDTLGPLTATQSPSQPIHDDPIPADSPAAIPVGSQMFDDRPVRDRSPRRGERSTATQVLADIDSNTGRLHTRAEKQLGKRKARRQCCFCPKRHLPKNCHTGRELKTRDEDAWTVRCDAWEAGEDAQADDEQTETRKRLVSLESTLQTFMAAMTAKETERTAMELETVTTRARMVSSSPWMGSTGPWMASTGHWGTAPAATPAMSSYGLNPSFHSVRNGNIATHVPYDPIPPLSRPRPPVQDSYPALSMSQFYVQPEPGGFYQGPVQGGI